MTKRRINPIREDAEIVLQLKAAGDTADQTAQNTIQDTTRLTRLLTILNDPLPFKQLLDRVLTTLSELFSADVVILLDPVGSGKYTPLASIGLPEETINRPFSHSMDSYTKMVMDSKHPVILDEMHNDLRVDAQLRDLGALTSIWLPVSSRDSVRGVLILARCKPAKFNKSEVDLLSAMTYRVSLSLEQAQKSYQLEQVVVSGHEIGSNLEEAAVFSRVISRFPKIIGVDAAALIVQNSAGQQKCVARKDIDPGWLPAILTLAGRFIAEVESNNAVSYSTGELSRIMEQLNIKRPPDFNMCAVLAVPITIRGTVQGVLCGIRYSDTPYNADTHQVAMLYASQTSAAIENARLYRSVQDELAVREKVGRELKASDERFRALIKSVTDVISILTTDGQITYISQAAEEAWDCPIKTLLTQNLFDRVHPDHVSRVRELFSSILEQPNETMKKTARLRHGEDGWRDFEITLTNLIAEPAVGGLVATFHDITERRSYEHKLKNLAYHDALTGLPNRMYFRERLERALIQCKMDGQKLAVVYLDLDSFKVINDSMGHAWGDHLLWTVADRLRACLRDSDSVARLGGDEFTVLIEEVTDAEQVIPIVQRFINALKKPVRLRDQNVYVGASFGIAISSPDDQVDNLLRNADVAMYQAKKQGKGGYVFYEPTLVENDGSEHVTMRLVTITDLHRALQQKEFFVAYHPIVSLANRRIFGADTSVHWQHPIRGIISAVGLLPLAIETEIIPEIGKWYMNETFNKIRKWQEISPLVLTIKIRAQYIKRFSVLGDVKSLMVRNNINPAQLILEITDINHAQDIESLVEKSGEIKNLGLRIAIDEFGAGENKLEILQLFPIDILKLSLSYMKRLEPGSWKALAEGTIKFARTFGMRVIADGIQSEEQASILREMGCEYGQGDFFSPPLSPDDFEALLKKE